MEIQEGPYKDYSPFKRGYVGFHVRLGECRAYLLVARSN